MKTTTPLLSHLHDILQIKPVKRSDKRRPTGELARQWITRGPYQNGFRWFIGRFLGTRYHTANIDCIWPSPNNSRWTSDSQKSKRQIERSIETTHPIRWKTGGGKGGRREGRRPKDQSGKTEDEKAKKKQQDEKDVSLQTELLRLMHTRWQETFHTVMIIEGDDNRTSVKTQ